MVTLKLTNKEALALSTALDVCTDKCPHLREDEIIPLNETLWGILKRLPR